MLGSGVHHKAAAKRDRLATIARGAIECRKLHDAEREIFRLTTPTGWVEGARGVEAAIEEHHCAGRSVEIDVRLAQGHGADALGQCSCVNHLFDESERFDNARIAPLELTLEQAAVILDAEFL